MRRTAAGIEERKAAKQSAERRGKNKSGNKRGLHPNSLAVIRKNKARPFPKGVSGNPGGLPGCDLAAVIARRIFEQVGKKIAKGMAKQLTNGNAYAFSVLADRGYGKVKDKHEISGVDGEPLRLTVELVKAKK